jgi:hypothetical protein
MVPGAAVGVEPNGLAYGYYYIICAEHVVVEDVTAGKLS